MTLHTESILTLAERGPQRILMSDVIKVVIRNYRVSINELRSGRRGPLFVRAKQAAYFLGRTFTDQSYPQVARPLNKDHSTVVHGDKKVRRNPAKYEPELSRCIAELQHKTEPQPVSTPLAASAPDAVRTLVPVSGATHLRPRP